jgi:hypothetical protein
MQVLNRVVAQSADAGTLPTLYAATADLPGATYVGPDGPGEMRGSPKVVGVSRRPPIRRASAGCGRSPRS